MTLRASERDYLVAKEAGSFILQVKRKSKAIDDVCATLQNLILTQSIALLNVFERTGKSSFSALDILQIQESRLISLSSFFRL
jgi:hypothetical protein